MPERLKPEQIPKEVWREVWDKWAPIKRWSDELWLGCALCEYLYKKHLSSFVCDYCPLSKTGFCKSYADWSKLNRNYHKTATQWRKAVKEFLEYIKPYCKFEEEK